MENDQSRMVYEQNHFGLPVDQETILSDHKGVYNKKVEKRQANLLKNVTFINRFLMKDEKILLVTKCCSPMSALEQLLVGWVIVYLKRSILVLTNYRILHIPTDISYKYRNSIAEINYADCRSIKTKTGFIGGGQLVIEYTNGHKETFHYMDKKERKKIKTLLETIPLKGKSSLAQKRIHLCPRCTKELQERNYTCPHCSLEFKNMKEARKTSIIYPGGGYFYTGHPLLGISDALGEAFLSLLVIVSLVYLFSGDEGAWIAAVLYSGLLAIEKVLTIYHSNHFINEFIPARKELVATT